MVWNQKFFAADLSVSLCISPVLLVCVFTAPVSLCFSAEWAAGGVTVKHHHALCARIWKSQSQFPELLTRRVLLQPLPGDHQHRASETSEHHRPLPHGGLISEPQHGNESANKMFSYIISQNISEGVSVHATVIRVKLCSIIPLLKNCSQHSHNFSTFKSNVNVCKLREMIRTPYAYPESLFPVVEFVTRWVCCWTACWTTASESAPLGRLRGSSWWRRCWRGGITWSLGGRDRPRLLRAKQPLCCCSPNCCR